jgi:hypothetical protein
MQEVMYVAPYDLVYAAQLPGLYPTIHAHGLTPFIEEADDMRQAIRGAFPILLGPCDGLLDLPL